MGSSLQIKKLLDDQHDSEDLDFDLTVAEVFVDNGKARADGLDQRAVVRVIQKPAERAPVRYGSILQDWEARSRYYAQRNSTTHHRPPVPLFPGPAPPASNYNPTIADSIDDTNRDGRENTHFTPKLNQLPEIPESELPIESTEVEDEDEHSAPHRTGEMSPILVVDSQPEARKPIRNTQGIPHKRQNITNQYVK